MEVLSHLRSVLDARFIIVVPPSEEQEALDDDEKHEDEQDHVFDQEECVMMALKALPTRIARRSQGCEECHDESQRVVL